MFWVVFVVVILVLEALCVVMLIRNREVYHHSMDMLNRVYAKAKADINRDREWIWRYDELDSIPHSTKLFKFWKPLSSFYSKDPAREDR